MDKSEINAPNGSEPKINNNVQKDDQDVNKVKDNTVIEIQLVKKTKKNEPKIFPALVLVDKEAFQPCGQENTRFIMKEFWRSANNRIIVAKKQSTGAILGYAIYTTNDTRDPRFGKKWIKSCYLLRIAVRLNSQGQGIGKKMVNYLLMNYPEHALSLDVSTDNTNAVEFYKRVGLKVQKIYLSEPDKVEFALMETELDKQGNKIPSEYEINLARSRAGNDDQAVLKLLKQRTSSPVHAYYKDFEQYKRHNSIVYVDGEPVDAVEPPQLLKVKSKSKAKTAQKQKEDVFKLGNLTDFEKVKVQEQKLAEVAETATKELTETEKQTSAKKCTEVITNSNEGGQDGQDSTKSSQDIQNTNEKEGDQEERGRNTSGKQGAMGQIQC